MKSFKSLSFTVALGISTISAFALPGSGGTGSPASIAGSITLVGGTPITLITNNIVITGLQIISTNSTFVSFYDCGTTNLPYSGTNYVTSAYAFPTSITTNLVTSFVGYNGYTNYYTNANVNFTYTATNAAATNALAPLGTYAAVSGVLCSYDANMLFGAGVSVYCPNTVTLIYYYRINR